MPALSELETAYLELRVDAEFQAELERLLTTYAGRPTPISHARRLTEKFSGAQTHLKRETLTHPGAPTITLAGGVAATSGLRRVLAERSPVPVVVPPPDLCTDNGAMIAACAHYRLEAGDVATLDLDINPALQIG